MTNASTTSTARTVRRRAGVTVPLFSLRTTRSWGIGEIGDLVPFAEWVRQAGISLVQLLPLNETSGADTSPYGAVSAFAIEPLYISMADVPELRNLAAETLLDEQTGKALERARAAAAVDYPTVRASKERALRVAFERLEAATPERQRDFERFRHEQAWWLADYALFRAIKGASEGKAWMDWRPALRDREPAALDEARATLDGELRFFMYVQWLAHSQWRAVRAQLKDRDLEVMGDLPFMVARDSADVWSNRDQFRRDASVGTPSDVFDPAGQDWDLPPYAWPAMRENDFQWLRARARETGALFDRFRIDHAVGFFRTYCRPGATKRDDAGALVAGAFDPEGEAAQIEHGERVTKAMAESAGESGARLVAEDLGTVPDFVRASLAKLEVPGYKVLRWEKNDATFRPISSYPVIGIACFGTHDTDSVASWWKGMPASERAGLLAIAPEVPGSPEFTRQTHQALVALLCSAPSELVLLLVQDLLGNEDRINVPGTVGPENWSMRLPRDIADLRADPAIAELFASTHESIQRSGRI